jgi:hypothetical protein
MHSEAEHSLLNENVIKQQKRTSFQKCIWFLCAILTILASLSIAYISILNMIHVESIDDTGTIFLSFYMCLLTLILFLFEIIQIKPCTKIDHIYQRNFGFLYNLAGKGSYIILYVSSKIQLYCPIIYFSLELA